MPTKSMLVPGSMEAGLRMGEVTLYSSPRGIERKS